MAHGSRTAVAAAIVGNTLVMIAKTAAFLVSGSAAMLSEALHSLADTANQVLLMIGIVRSDRRADDSFPFGYGAERYVWALMSAVGIFFLGCGVTVYHGVSAFMNPHPLDDLGWAMVVLALSFVLEAAVLALALRTVHAAAAGRPLLAYIRTEADPSTVAVVLEDSAACLGVVLALGGLILSRITGSPRWDAVASIVIGLLLGAIAVWLVARNRHLLVGPAIPLAVRQRIRSILATHPAVARVVDLRTRVLDADTYRVAAEIEFNGEVLADRLEDELLAEFAEISGAGTGAGSDYDYAAFRAFAARYADQIIELLGDEVDRIEDDIRRQVPRARFLDIETD